MREEHNRRAARETRNIVLQPRDLLGAERPEPTGLEVQDVHEADEMHASVIETVPAATLRAFTVSLEV